MSKALKINITTDAINVNVPTLGTYVSSYDTLPASVLASSVNDILAAHGLATRIEEISPEKAFREAVGKVTGRHGAIKQRGYKAVPVEKTEDKTAPQFGIVFTYRNATGDDAEGVQEFVARLEGDEIAFYASVDGNGTASFTSDIVRQVAREIRDEFKLKAQNLVDSARIAMALNTVMRNDFGGNNVRHGATFFILPPDKTEAFRDLAASINEAFYRPGVRPTGVRLISHHISPEDRQGDVAQELGMTLTVNAVDLQDEIEAYLKEWRQTPEGRKKTMGATMAIRFEERIEEAVRQAQAYRNHYDFNVATIKDALRNAMDLAEILGEEVEEAGIKKPKNAA